MGTTKGPGGPDPLSGAPRGLRGTITVHLGEPPGASAGPERPPAAPGAPWRPLAATGAPGAPAAPNAHHSHGGGVNPPSGMPPRNEKKKRNGKRIVPAGLETESGSKPGLGAGQVGPKRSRAQARARFQPGRAPARFRALRGQTQAPARAGPGPDTRPGPSWPPALARPGRARAGLGPCWGRAKAALEPEPSLARSGLGPAPHGRTGRPLWGKCPQKVHLPQALPLQALSGRKRHAVRGLLRPRG